MNLWLERRMTILISLLKCDLFSNLRTVFQEQEAIAFLTSSSADFHPWLWDDLGFLTAAHFVFK